MKKSFIFLLFLSFQLGVFAQTNSEVPWLFPTVKGDKYGFINRKGKVVVPPKFRAVTRFSEGLVAVREAGQYGYIDATGTYIIPPIFDYAEPFKKGMAIAYLAGQPYFINKKGELLFDLGFKELFPFKDGRAKVKTETGKFGIIDTTGKLIIDTIFQEIQPFKDGIAIVKGIRKGKGIIDTKGNFIVKFGRFYTIEPFSEGYAYVRFDDEKEEGFEGFINTKGVLQFTIPNSLGRMEWKMHNGLAPISILRTEVEGIENRSYTERYKKGYINLKGAIVLVDTFYREVKGFVDNRAIVKTKEAAFIIDKYGNRVGGKTFSYIATDHFKNGLLPVLENGKYGIIDTNANYIFPPVEEDIELIVEDYFFIEDRKKYGIGRVDGTIIFPTKLDDFDKNGFQHGLLMGKMEGQLIYIDEQGEVVWKEQKVPTDTILKPMYIDYMNEAWYYYAKSGGKPTDFGYRTWSKRLPKPILSTQQFPANKLSIILPDEAIINFNGFQGRRILVGNTTKTKQHFNAQDSQLYLSVQAKDRDGQWRDIEYLPSSWCGNSYYSLELAANHYWELKMPIYEGALPTQLRVALYLDGFGKKANVIYSPIFKGSINPGQFWRKLPHHPSGLMDPYTNK